MSSRAVLFGIDYLLSARVLQGCARDVHDMKIFLDTELHYDRIQVYTQQDTPSKVTRYGIMKTLWKLVARSHTESLDRAWIHFSGHGLGIRDHSGDEIDGLDEAICPVDYETMGIITDDDLHRVLRNFNVLTKVTCVFDCCHSGTIGDLRYRYDGLGLSVISNHQDQSIDTDLLMISGCRDNQTSSEIVDLFKTVGATGAMSSCLLNCMRDHLSQNRPLSISTLYPDLCLMLSNQQLSQIPVITSSLPITHRTTIA
jgi:hypothetical protein